MATAEASKQRKVGFPPKGSLKRFPFPRLLREIAGRKLTGSLYLLSTQTKKVVFFEDGNPVFVRSNVLSECLGQILASEGLITQEQCEQTLEAIRRTGKKQGELLVEMGILSEGNLRYGLQAQLRAKLFDIFSWDDGRYQFKRDTPNLKFGVKLDASAESVIIEAIQDQYPEERALAALGDPDNRYPRASPELTNAKSNPLRLLPEEEHFFRCLDGSRSAQQVIEEPPEPVVPSPAALLFGLSQSGLVSMLSERSERGPAPPPPQLGVAPQDDADEVLAPPFEATTNITEYEDTPLPGQLPRSPGLLGDHEDDFAGVEDSGLHVRAEVSKQLRAAEGDAIDETFDDSLIDAESQMELIGAADFELDADDHEDESGDDAPAASEPGQVAAKPSLALDLESRTQPAMLDELDAPPAVEAAELDTPTEPDAPALLPAPPLADVDTTRPSTKHPRPGAPAAAARHPSEEVRLDSVEEIVEIDAELISIEPVDAPGAMGNPAVDLEAIEADDDLALDAALPSVATASDDLDDIDLGDIDLALSDDLDDLDLSDLGGPPADAAAPRRPLEEAESSGPHSEALGVEGDALIDFDDLDAVDLGGEMDALPDAAAIDPIEETEAEVAQVQESAEVVGARRFNDAETVMGEGRYGDAVGLLEEAYDNGFDVAELHAMLAYARFMAADQDRATAQHAFELLDYAQNMDPSLDLVHAYRGAIHQATGESGKARESLDRALELNPYCDLAMELMDSLG